MTENIHEQIQICQELIDIALSNNAGLRAQYGFDNVPGWVTDEIQYNVARATRLGAELRELEDQDDA